MEINFTGFEQKLLMHQQTFVPHIYDQEGFPPVGFNVACVRLEASARSRLDWNKEIIHAEALIEKGYFILWDLEFELSEDSLEDETLFLSLKLSLDHFCNTIWKQFGENSFGVALFRGALTLQNRDAILGYLKTLAAFLPEEASCFLFLDTSYVKDAVTYFQLTSQVAFPPFHLIVKGEFATRYPYAFPAFGWDHEMSPFSHPIRIKQAICLSEKVEKRAFQALIEQLGTTPFRVIPEEILTYEWDGIDVLFVLPGGISKRGQRKLDGFVAAGGRVIKFPSDEAWLRLQENAQPFSPVS